MLARIYFFVGLTLALLLTGLGFHFYNKGVKAGGNEVKHHKDDNLKDQLNDMLSDIIRENLEDLERRKANDKQELPHNHSTTAIIPAEWLRDLSKIR